MVRDGYVLAKVNDVVRESVSCSASNLGSWLAVKGFVHGKAKNTQHHNLDGEKVMS